MATRKQERILNPNGWRHYRRRYSLTEVRIGLMILAGLVGISIWIYWRGVNPDPELFSVSETLLDKGSSFEPRDGLQAGLESPARTNNKAPKDRGPVPDELTTEGWNERSISQFDASNLYEKINGREGYYKSFGFQKLYFISLLHDEDETASIDIEMYDLGTVSNALGAYAGERQPDAEPEVSGSGISHVLLNALYVVQGRFYIRAIGSDDSELITSQLSHLQKRFGQGLKGEALPWAYTLFVGQLGRDPGKVGYQPENAFSFGFAKNVYTIEIDEEGTELFVVAAASDDEAKNLAKEFIEGFRSIGKDAGEQGGITWIEDQYLSTLATATPVGQLVVGIRGAPSKQVAEGELGKLREAAGKLPAEVIEAAIAAQGKGGGAAGYGSDEGEEDSGGGDGDSEPSPEESAYGDEPEGGEPSPEESMYDEEVER